MGLFRNCGSSKIGGWIFLKVTGLGNDPFPLLRVAFLEELSTVAAVDSVSEVMAMIGVVLLVSGEAISAATDPDSTT